MKIKKRHILLLCLVGLVTFVMVSKRDTTPPVEVQNLEIEDLSVDLGADLFLPIDGAEEDVSVGLGIGEDVQR